MQFRVLRPILLTIVLGGSGETFADLLSPPSKVLDPSLAEFHYENVAEVMNNLNNFPKVGRGKIVEICRETKISTETDLMGNDYFLLKDCKNKFTYFKIARVGHGTYEIYGPLRRKSQH